MKNEVITALDTAPLEKARSEFEQQFKQSTRTLHSICKNPIYPQLRVINKTQMMALHQAKEDLMKKYESLSSLVTEHSILKQSADNSLALFHRAYQNLIPFELDDIDSDIIRKITDFCTKINLNIRQMLTKFFLLVNQQETNTEMLHSIIDHWFLKLSNFTLKFWEHHCKSISNQALFEDYGIEMILKTRAIKNHILKGITDDFKPLVDLPSIETAFLRGCGFEHRGRFVAHNLPSIPYYFWTNKFLQTNLLAKCWESGLGRVLLNTHLEAVTHDLDTMKKRLPDQAQNYTALRKTVTERKSDPLEKLWSDMLRSHKH